MNRIQIEDYENIGKYSFIDWELLRNTTVLITGSTGLIGSNLVNTLAYNSEKKKLDIKLVLPVRNIEKARAKFEWTGAEIIPYILGEQFALNKRIDYIVHLASPTSSRSFKEEPVNTMLDNIKGTVALLDLAKEHEIKKFIYLSTMEVYGYPEKGHIVMENEIGAFEPMNARNSYPIAKIASEALCYDYFSQFGVPTVVLRPTQTFGPGVDPNDGRVFAQFMKCVLEGKNIVLKSEGLTERCYLYTADAVSAIVVALLKAKEGESYTVANPKTYISISDMANMVCNTIADGRISVEYDLSELPEKLGYADTLYMDLDTSKMNKIGWIPYTDLEDMFARMVEGR